MTFFDSIKFGIGFTLGGMFVSLTVTLIVGALIALIRPGEKKS